MKKIALGLFLLLVGLTVWSYLSGGVMDLLLRADMDAGVRLTLLQEYFRSWGLLAPAVYLVIVAIEVVLAPIPGTLLYLPGGVIFGGFLGGSLALAGNVLGAGVAFQIARVLGGARVSRFIKKGKLKKFEDVIEKHGLWIIFLLRVNPFTSSDVVSYAAGLTKLRLWKVMAGTLLGMAPLCYVQAYFAQEIFAAFPGLIYPLVLFGVLYAAYIARHFRQLTTEGHEKERAVALAPNTTD